MKQNKTSLGFYESGATWAEGMCLLLGCGHKSEEENTLIFKSHWGLYGEFNPRVFRRGWCLGFCQFRVEMSNYQAQQMYKDLFISCQTLSLCLSWASITTAWRECIKHTHTHATNYSSERSVFCLGALIERVEGRQTERQSVRREWGGGADEQRSRCKVLWLEGVIILQRWRHWMQTGHLPSLHSPVHSRATVGRDGRRRGEGDGLSNKERRLALTVCSIFPFPQDKLSRNFLK